MTLLAFLGHTRPNSPERHRQVGIVADAARACDDVIEERTQDHIDIETGVRLAAAFHRNPALKVVILPVARPF
jgi:hypothetical protein